MTKAFVEKLHGPDIYQGFVVDEVLYEGATPYQRISIYTNKRFGRVLVLDGVVQTTEKDEFMYHEMLVHVPLFSCPDPRRVLIVGGGDGGSLREVIKHDIEHVDMVEIDREVVDLCTQYLPSLNDGGRVFDDPRVALVIEDAFEFIQREQRKYDVILCDSTDPIGVAQRLFSSEFYELCQKSLNPNGVIALQDGVIFLQPDESRRSMRVLRALGLRARCYVVAVPTYYGGNMTLGYATNQPALIEPDAKSITARFAKSRITTRHYTPDHHVASFALPKWMGEITGEY